MYGRPWYVQATDVAHRLFVLSIIGGSGKSRSYVHPPTLCFFTSLSPTLFD